jgi:predicted regulator of Ras-like GTPase activity (Roadblock/LC7/MglB family)
MKTLKDSSELRETRELLLALMNEPGSDPTAAAGAAPQKAVVAASDSPAVSAAASTVVRAPEAAPAAHEPEDAPVEQWVALSAPGGDLPATPLVASPQSSRSDRLHNILALLCEREGFTGALVTDNSGLPLAASSAAAASENLAAFSTVLGDALVKASSYLGQDDATDVSLDINARQRIVLRRFALEGRPCYLLVLCTAGQEPRRAMAAAIPGIVSTLAVS